jgi:hypothetical protein
MLMVVNADGRRSMTLLALGGALALYGGCIWCTAGAAAASIASVTVAIMCLAAE